MQLASSFSSIRHPDACKAAAPHENARVFMSSIVCSTQQHTAACMNPCRPSISLCAAAVFPACSAQNAPTVLQAKIMAKTKAKVTKDIPTPFVREIQTYRWDYLPIHREPRTYIRGKGQTCSPFSTPCPLPSAPLQLA